MERMMWVVIVVVDVDFILHVTLIKGLDAKGTEGIQSLNFSD